MKKTLFFITVLTLLILLSTSTVFAGKPDGDSGYPWQDERKAPFDFEFGNMIDTHQQTKLLNKVKESKKEKESKKRKAIEKRDIAGFHLYSLYR